MPLIDKENYQKVNKIDASIIEIRELCSIEDALTEVGKEVSSVFSLFKKSPLKFRRVKSSLSPFWLIEANHTIDYEYQTLLNIPINEANTKHLIIADNTYEVKNPTSQKSIEVPATGVAHYEKKTSYIYDSRGMLIQNDALYRKYVELHNSDNTPLESYSAALNNMMPELETQMPPAQQNLEKKIISDFYNLTKSTTDNTLKYQDNIHFTTVNLYFHPIFTFEYVNEETEEVKEIEIDGVTGKVIKESMLGTLKSMLHNNREPITEISAEIVGSFIPGTGYIIRELGKRMQ